MKKNGRRAIFWAICGLIGYLVHLEHAWAISLFLPVTYWYSKETTSSSAIKILENYVGSVLCFLFGAVFWMPLAIERVAHTSWFLTSVVFMMAALYHGILYAGANVVYAFSKRFQTWFLSALSFSILVSGFPIFLSISLGDLLTKYTFFHSTVACIGTIGLTFVVSLAGTALVEAIRTRQKIFLLVPLLGVGLVCGINQFFPRTDFNQFATQNNIDEKDLQFAKTADPGLNILAVQSNLTSEYINKYNGPALEFAKFQTNQVLSPAKTILQNLRNNDIRVHLMSTPEGGFSASLIQEIFPTQAQRWVRSYIMNAADTLQEYQTHFLAVNELASLNPDNKYFDSKFVRGLPTLTLYDPTALQIERIPKGHLIPFVEYIPGAKQFPILYDIFSWVTGDLDQSGRQSFYLNGFLVGGLICYDSIFRDSYWKLLDEKANFALVLTNDNPLGPEGAWLHRQITIAKSLEYGLLTYFNANTGVSGFTLVDGPTQPWGQFGYQILHVSARIPSGSVYSSYVGRWLEPTIASLAALIFALSIFTLGYAGIRGLRHLSIQKVMQFFSNTIVMGTLIGVTIVAVTTQYFFQFSIIPSDSMDPTLAVGDRIVLCKFQQQYKRGDVVTFYDWRSGSFVIKRIILEPGDQYELLGQVPYVNGQPISFQKQAADSHLYRLHHSQFPDFVVRTKDEKALWPTMNLKMEADQFFVMGDHRDHSFDSRFFGPVYRNEIKGRYCR